MIQKFMQKIKTIWTKLKPALTGLSTIITILGIGFLGILSPLKESIEPIRILENTKIIESIRIGSSEKYVESALGVPKREQIIEYVSETSKRYQIKRKDYYNKDFLYSAYFTDGQGLIGVGLISKNKHFRPRIPTKSSQALLKYTQEQLVPDTPWFIKSNFCGTRADNSDFLLEFVGPNLPTNYLFIAYGTSELGYISKYDEKYFYDYIMNLLEFYEEIHNAKTQNTETTEKLLNNKKEDRRKIHSNAVFVMSNFAEDESIGFIDQEMDFMFLYSRLDYRLLND
jgi:hypothetical protein